jgi:flavodoxin I
MQDDWVEFAPGVGALNLSGVKVGLFGCGDQAGYPTTFGDALGLLWEQIKGTGATLVGTTSTEGYEFESSKGVGDDGRFLGLLVDNDNEQDLSEGRIEGWAEALRVELGVGAAAAS